MRKRFSEVGYFSDIVRKPKLSYKLEVNSSNVRRGLFLSQRVIVPRGFAHSQLAIVLAVFFGLAASGSIQAQVVINEVGASNGSSVENNAKFPDWIEFYN